jgi:hypothetical protein
MSGGQTERRASHPEAASERIDAPVPLKDD